MFDFLRAWKARSDVADVTESRHEPTSLQGAAATLRAAGPLFPLLVVVTRPIRLRQLSLRRRLSLTGSTGLDANGPAHDAAQLPVRLLHDPSGRRPESLPCGLASPNTVADGNASLAAEFPRQFGLSGGQWPFISIVVPVRNEARHICATLEMLLDQDYPPDRVEILVVDGMSQDRTRELVQLYVDEGSPIRLLENPRIWSSAARNVGVLAARGDLVVVIDGHCELPDRLHLRSLAEAFAASGADIVGRPQPLTVRNASPCQRAIALARASRLGHHPDSFIYSQTDQFVPAQSVGAAYRRDVFQAIGYFDEQFDACEDVDFNHRADLFGLRCFLATKARVHYHPRPSLRSLFRQLARYGRGRIRLARKHPETCTWKSLAPAGWLIWMLGSLLWACYGGWGPYLLGGSLALYLGAVLVTSLLLIVNHRPGIAALWVPLVFVTIHVAAGYGLLHEMLAGCFRGSRRSQAIAGNA